ncbi:PAS and helix-turn-helix domain-containing protein [Legionella worsleiensis]|nr:PAS and helix-turn-helix domain-containing protein [Legionella worsleiensis]
MHTHLLLDQIPGYFSILDANSNFLFGNAFSLKVSGFRTLDKMQGRSYCDMKCKASEQHSEFFRQDRLVIQQKKTLRILGRYCYHDDNWRIVYGEKFILKNEDNQLSSIAQHFYDVTHTNVFNLMILCEFDSKSNKSLGQQSFIIEDNYPEISLSERETECFFYLLRGHSAKSVSTKLNLSVRTVESYLENIKNKLNCTTKSELIEKAYSLGYLHIIPKALFQINSDQA